MSEAAIGHSISLFTFFSGIDVFFDVRGTDVVFIGSVSVAVLEARI